MLAEIESPARHRKRLVLPGRIPEFTRLALRSLYVVHGKAPSEIASALQLSLNQVNGLIKREGWTQERDRRLNQKAEKVAQEQDAHAIESTNRVNEVVGVLAEELTVGSLTMCADALTEKDAKKLQMASSAARNLDQVRRAARNLDRGDSLNTQITNLAFFSIGRAAPDPVNVTASAPLELPAAPTA